MAQHHRVPSNSVTVTASHKRRGEFKVRIPVQRIRVVAASKNADTFKSRIRDSLARQAGGVTFEGDCLMGPELGSAELQVITAGFTFDESELDAVMSSTRPDEELIAD